MITEEIIWNATTQQDLSILAFQEALKFGLLMMVIGCVCGIMIGVGLTRLWYMWKREDYGISP